MLLDRPLSWRQRCWPQPVNQAQNLDEQVTGLRARLGEVVMENEL